MIRIKILFQQVLMISTGILFIAGIDGVVSFVKGTDFFFPWYYPFSIILLGFLCALPTFLFILKDWGKRVHFIVRLILHYLSVWVITSIIGWGFHWYSDWIQFLKTTIEYTMIYVFVWVTTLWFIRTEDKKINQALKEIQDDE